jgi:hypothetical protein
MKSLSYLRWLILLHHLHLLVLLCRRLKPATIRYILLDLLCLATLGSSDVIAQPKYNASGTITGTKSAPLGVAHLGIWDTVHYTAAGTGGDSTTPTTPSAAIKPGVALYPAQDEAKVTTSESNAGSAAVYNGERVSTVTVARVVKGASVAKATANIANTTLYPIRIKLLV